jgi:hypothetical protein
MLAFDESVIYYQLFAGLLPLRLLPSVFILAEYVLLKSEIVRGCK